MLPRYTVRAQSDLQYSVWDNERDKLAVLIDRKCAADLTFADAFKLADDLNAEPPVTARP